MGLILSLLCCLQAEEGLCAGRVLYHSHVHKSAEEDAQQQEEIIERTRLKSERRREQVAFIVRALARAGLKSHIVVGRVMSGRLDTLSAAIAS